MFKGFLILIILFEERFYGIVLGNIKIVLFL